MSFFKKQDYGKWLLWVGARGGFPAENTGAYFGLIKLFSHDSHGGFLKYTE